MLWKNILIVATGGALGTVLRYLAQKYIPVSPQSGFPVATFLINIAGCLLIGVFYELWVRKQLTSEEWRLWLMTGFCGGFTTFSAFTLEGLMLIRQERILTFFIYFAASLVLGLLATFAGSWLARL